VSTAVFFGYYWTRFPLGESRKVVVHGSMLATGVDLNRLFRPLYPLTGRCAIPGGLLDPKVAWRSEGAPSPFELGLHGGRQTSRRHFGPAVDRFPRPSAGVPDTGVPYRLCVPKLSFR
jgi:hypothetical protein